MASISRGTALSELVSEMDECIGFLVLTSALCRSVQGDQDWTGTGDRRGPDEATGSGTGKVPIRSNTTGSDIYW
jgi:hypothetical protein